MRGRVSTPLRRPRQLFLSHSHKDRLFTAKLANALRDHGIRVWYSEHNIRGAQQWHDEIGAALRRCDWLAVVLTPNAVASTWVQHELLYAVRTRRYHRHVVPILVKPCKPEKLSWTLPNLQMVRFGRGFHAGCTDLLNIWGINYER
jgi:hypothetical protein